MRVVLMSYFNLKINNKEYVCMCKMHNRWELCANINSRYSIYCKINGSNSAVESVLDLNSRSYDNNEFLELRRKEEVNGIILLVMCSLAAGSMAYF